VTGILAEILAHKRGEVERARRDHPLDELKSLAGYYLPRRNFYGAVTAPGRGGPNLIAEVKRSSPSAGLIQADFDPVRIAQQYAAGGARALSVLTDEKYFGGRLEYIAAVKAAVGLPVLRKDFLIDAYQVYESRAGGADAVLVIGEALDPTAAAELVALARSLGLWVLLEVHTRAGLLAAFDVIHTKAGAGVLLGINNRDLETQRVELATVEDLAPLVAPGVPIVAESGVKTRQDVERLHAAGARAILVGETLMRSGDPARTIRELFG
jgi:indole-3-glycerol phosphate synthase